MTLPDDFDWPELPSQVTPDRGRAWPERPSYMRPWDAAEIRGLTGKARETIRERATLALTDPENERDAVAPLSGVRARWILLTLAEQDAARRAPVPWRRGDRLPDGRELLTRLGADPGRGRGVMRCPAHEDRSPSLSWRLAEDGRALLHCFSGCTFADVLATLK